MEFTNSIKKYIRSLHQRKHRQKYDKFIAEGPKVCKEFLMCKAYEIEYILALPDWIERNQELLADYKDYLYPIKAKELQQLSLLKTPNQLISVWSMEQSIPEGPSAWSLYLDGIRDPGNLGTMIRIADWFGISTIYATSDSVDYYNPKVVQGAMGSHNRVELKVATLEELWALNKAVYGLVLDGEDLSSLTPSEPGIIAIGNESKGLSSDLISNLTYRCTIRRRGGAESLNAAIACGIACQNLIP